MKRVRLIGEIFATNVVKERWGEGGRTLGSYLAEAANGVDLRLEDPFGAWHTVSLAPFAGQNSDRWLVFTYIATRDNEDFDEDDAPAPEGNAVILLEYDLPADAEPPAATAVTPRDYGDGTLLKKYQLPPGVKMIERADL
jgi:hypothetical protein